MDLRTLAPRWGEFLGELEGRIRILVVDDEPSARLVFKEILSDQGFEVEECEEALPALERLAAERFDVVLIDKNLGDVTGLDVLKRLRTERIAVDPILVTGYPSLGTVAQALAFGAVDYLTKPLEIDHARRRVRSVVNDRLWRLMHERVTDDLARALKESKQRDAVHAIAETVRERREALERLTEVLVLDPDAERGARTADELREGTVRAVHGMGLEDFPPLSEEGPLCVLADSSLDLAAVRSRAEAHGTPSQLVASSISPVLEHALEALDVGATDFVAFGLEGTAMLLARVRRALAEARRQRMFSYLMDAVRASLPAPGRMPPPSPTDEASSEETIDLVDLVESSGPRVTGDPLGEQALRLSEAPGADWDLGDFEIES